MSTKVEQTLSPIFPPPPHHSHSTYHSFSFPLARLFPWCNHLLSLPIVAYQRQCSSCPVLAITAITPTVDSLSSPPFMFCSSSMVAHCCPNCVLPPHLAARNYLSHCISHLHKFSTQLLGFLRGLSIYRMPSNSN